MPAFYVTVEVTQRVIAADSVEAYNFAAALGHKIERKLKEPISAIPSTITLEGASPNA